MFSVVGAGSIVVAVVVVSGRFTITTAAAIAVSIGGSVIRYHFPLWVWISGRHGIWWRVAHLGPGAAVCMKGVGGHSCR